jgi:hypothetical protein
MLPKTVAALTFLGLAPSLAEAQPSRGQSREDWCAKLASVYREHIAIMERTCRVGPQPPRYHSCNDQKSHIRAMSENILGCKGMPDAIRQLAEVNAHRFAREHGDRRGPSPEQSATFACEARVRAACMQPSVLGSQQCVSSNIWQCYR